MPAISPPAPELEAPAPAETDPAASYAALQATHRAAHTVLLRRRGQVLALLGLTVVAFLLLAFAPVREALGLRASAQLSALPYLLLLAGFVFLVTRYLRLQAGIDTQDRLLVLYATALGRVEGTEVQSGQHGPAPAAGHLYARDLDLFGPHSLFGLLATVRTTIGEQGLTRLLLEPATQQEAVSRQQAVRELAPQTGLREQIALLGVSNLQRISASLIEDWRAAPPPRFHTALRPALLFTAALAVILLTRPGLLGLHSTSAAMPRLALVLAVQAALCSTLRTRVSPLLASSVRLQQSVRLLGEGLALLDSLRFTSPRLQDLQQKAREPAGAVRELRRLQSLLTIAEQRGQGYFLPLSLLTAAGVQTAISLATWKRRHAQAMRNWLDAWSEFEALSALATYAFEHPCTGPGTGQGGTGDHCWPELLPATHPPLFEAGSLRHPLLADAVPNEVALGPGTRFFLISGSNMSGKSTLLRAIGVNAVLAYAGAPVRASSLRLTPLALGASLALTDSLAEGKSKFRAEVERLADLVAVSRQQPLLFLVDEIFSGTNSADRRTAASAVLATLLGNGAIGALSTHDLALTELASAANAGVNLHMASPDPDDPLAFDYTLKAGPNTSSNALAIIRMLGLDA